MKSRFFFMALSLLMLASCSGVGSKEKKFVKDMQSEDIQVSSQAFDDFCKWMMTDRATMTHDFNLMREKFAMKLITSPDGKLRAYSWVTGYTDKVPTYANIMQWTIDNRFVGYIGPVDALVAGRQADAKKLNINRMPHSIDTIYQINLADDVPAYIMVQSYTNLDGLSRAYASAITYQGLSLKVLPFFFDGTEIAGNNLFVAPNGKIDSSKLFKWDEKAKRFFAYQTDENNKIIPGKFTEYVFEKDHFKRLSVEEAK